MRNPTNVGRPLVWYVSGDGQARCGVPYRRWRWWVILFGPRIHYDYYNGPMRRESVE